jgi:hypothetical protein
VSDAQCERYRKLLLRQSCKSSQLLPPFAWHEIECEHAWRRHRGFCRRGRRQASSPDPIAQSDATVLGACCPLLPWAKSAQPTALSFHWMLNGHGTGAPPARRSRDPRRWPVSSDDLPLGAAAMLLTDRTSSIVGDGGRGSTEYSWREPRTRPWITHSTSNRRPPCRNRCRDAESWQGAVAD